MSTVHETEETMSKALILGLGWSMLNSTDEETGIEHLNYETSL